MSPRSEGESNILLSKTIIKNPNKYYSADDNFGK